LGDFIIIKEFLFKIIGIIMNNYYKHFKTIIKHKWFVMIECFKLGLYWQGIVHDLSKFSIAEFKERAKYFQKDRSAVNNIKNDNGISFSVLHHKGRNKHHWEYWVDFNDGKLIPCKMPIIYVKEMYCDMVGSSKAYHGKNYNKKEPLEYFLKIKNKIYMNEDNKYYLELLLKIHANLN